MSMLVPVCICHQNDVLMKLSLLDERTTDAGVKAAFDSSGYAIVTIYGSNLSALPTESGSKTLVLVSDQVYLSELQDS